MKALTSALITTALVLSMDASLATEPDGSPSAAAAAAPDDLLSARALIATKEWLSAIADLHRINDDCSVDWNNLMGYALREQEEPDFEAAHWYYAQALRIDPNHFGTLQALGELHLMQHDLAKAEQRLHTLGDACELACPQYRELKAAIGRYKATGNRFVTPVLSHRSGPAPTGQEATTSLRRRPDDLE